MMNDSAADWIIFCCTDYGRGDTSGKQSDSEQQSSKSIATLKARRHPDRNAQPTNTQPKEASTDTTGKDTNSPDKEDEKDEDEKSDDGDFYSPDPNKMVNSIIPNIRKLVKTGSQAYTMTRLES